MKTMFLKNSFFTMLMSAFAALSFVACDKDDDAAPLKKEIVGTWDITSYKLSGDEYMDLIFESAYLRFDAYTGDEGEFEQEVTFRDEESTSVIGDYEVDNAAGKVEMNYDGDVIIAEVEISNNGRNMRWDGEQDGFPLVILATKR